MQKMKAKKRIIASVLAVCMMVPYGTGSYKTAYAADRTDVAAVEAEAKTSNPEVTGETKASETEAAAQESEKSVATLAETEEQIQESGTISIDEVPELSEGDTKITEDNKKVAYTDESGQTAVWDGQVFCYTTPSKKNSAISLFLDGDEEKIYTIEHYILENDGKMTKVETQGSIGVYRDSTRERRFTCLGLEKGKTYYFVITASVSGAVDLTAATDMQDLMININPDVPYEEDILDKATDVTPGKTYTVEPVEMNVIYSKESLDPYAYLAGIYKITLPAGSQMAITMKHPDEGAGCAYKWNQNALIRTDDYEMDTSSKSGILYNFGTTEQTYYFLSANTIIEFGVIKKQDTVTRVESADIPELTLSSSIEITQLPKQRVSYDQEDQGSKETVQAEGMWMKFTVPEDMSYTVTAECNEDHDDDWDLRYSFTILQYDRTKGMCTACDAAELSCFNHFSDAVTARGEGEYYIYITCNMNYSIPITFRMKQTKKITEIKNDAGAITDADVTNGTFKVTGMGEPYAYPVKKEDGNGYLWETSDGKLMKMRVPAKTTYILSSDMCFFRIYETDCKTLAGDTYQTGKVMNTSNTAKDYYVWIGFELSDSAQEKIQIRKEQQVVAPQPVTNLKAVSNGKNTVRLTWTKSDKADGYLIYTKKNGVYGYRGLVSSGTQTSYTDTAALDSDYNFYWVYPFKKDASGKRVVGKCTKYVYAKGICTAVTGVKVSSVKGGVKLTWSKKAGASGYLVYAKRPGGKYGYIGMTNKYGTTTYTDKNASKSAYTFYWIIPYHYNANGKLVAGQTGKYVYGKAK